MLDCKVMLRVFVLFCCLGLHLWLMEVPRLGVELQLQLPAYTTAAATPDASCVCDLHHSSWQCWILYPLSEARDGTHILMATCSPPAAPLTTPDPWLSVLGSWGHQPMSASFSILRRKGTGLRGWGTWAPL